MDIPLTNGTENYLAYTIINVNTLSYRHYFFKRNLYKWKHLGLAYTTVEMRIIFIAVFLLATNGIQCSPSRRFEPSTFEKYFTKAVAVLRIHSYGNLAWHNLFQQFWFRIQVHKLEVAAFFFLSSCCLALIDI